ncbi:MAG: hypothetical protein HYW81_01020 [Parcubacteria group bacterium]|nr:hypothetical protein [Parcubacteria group bacterium]
MNYFPNISKTLAYLVISTVLATAGLRVGSFPAHAANITVSPPKFEFDADKGGRVTGAIAITNGDAEPLVLIPSVADFTAQGEAGKPAFVAGEDASAFSLSAWISLPAEAITVPANDRLEVPFTLTVPENAEAGGHFGTIFFSPVTEQSGTIAVEQKVGVLMLVRVAGEVREVGDVSVFAAYPSGIEAEDVRDAKQKSVFSEFPVSIAVRFTNTGNVHSKPSGTITLKNTFGTELVRVGEEVTSTETGAITGKELVDYLPVNDRGGNVLPNSSRVFLSEWKGYGSLVLNEQGEREIAWRGVGFGRYTAELDLSYGDTKLPARSIHFWIIPWMIILPSLAGLAILSILIKLWRKHSRERLKQSLREELEAEQQMENNELENS